eukprot:38967-Eustigmatos_ZCMA.PRE.1
MSRPHGARASVQRDPGLGTHTIATPAALSDTGVGGYWHGRQRMVKSGRRALTRDCELLDWRDGSVSRCRVYHTVGRQR